LDAESRQAYQERLQERIRACEEKLLTLAERSRRAEAALRSQLADEESDLRRALGESRLRLRELTQSSGEGWREVRAAAERIWEDLREAWKEEESPPPVTDRPAAPEGGESQ
jgi:hypothetical protein